jgi:hypothetical protein
MAIAGSCVSTMEKPRFSITTSSESAALLYTQYTRKKHAGHLASLASRHCGLQRVIIRHGQHHCSTWAEQSRMLSHPGCRCKSATRRILGRDAGSIPRVDGSVPLVT